MYYSVYIWKNSLDPHLWLAFPVENGWDKNEGDILGPSFESIIGPPLQKKDLTACVF